MRDDNIIQEKSFDFALRSVNVYTLLISKRKEYVLSKQFLRLATFIVANVEEAIGAQTSADFISKISIDYNEAREFNIYLKV